MAHVAEYKKKIVKNCVDKITEYPIIGAVNLEGLPAQQLQKIREQIRDIIVIIMSRKRLMKIAIEQSKGTKKNIDALLKHFEGMPAMVFTKENPFKLFKILSKNKSSAPAKAGQTAPKDIIIQPGATPFAPGPVISELSSVGLKVGVENGKVAVKEECTLVKSGEVISEEMANVLTKLGEKPMEVGLNLTAVYENGTIFLRDVLDIDEEKFMSNLNEACGSALNLAIEIGYPTKDTIELLVGKAALAAKAIAKECNILTSETVGDSLESAERETLGLKDKAGIEVPEKKAEEKPKEEKPAEKPAEEKPKVEEKPAEKPVEEKKEEPKAEPEKPIEKKPEEPVIEQPAEQEPEQEPIKEPEKPAMEEKPEKKEPVEELAEEISAEEPKPVEEKPAAEPEKPIKEKKPEPVEEKPAAEPKESVPKETEKEVERMVQAVKEHETGEDKKRSATLIVDEIEKEEQEKKEKEEAKQEKEEEKPKEDVPTAEELAKKKEEENKPEKNEEQAQAEELFEKLKKKGTLRE
ncbi:50S ribosomal protein L10 [Candidatus Woesearchaeota archaeon]|nr:50S ribosomal protein L10 [Candidatus Woesearchaeota archaeon]|tara:strand:+ start:4768 stop:6333 length:1566 start_codon:yes stop_codon:yes gene_type:complete